MTSRRSVITCARFLWTPVIRATTVPDGPSALRALHQEQCDLIVLDLEMPGVDGVALCRLLRAQDANQQDSRDSPFPGSDDEKPGGRSVCGRRG